MQTEPGLVSICPECYLIGASGLWAGIKNLWTAGLNGGSKSVFWSGENKIIAQSHGVTLELTYIGRLADGRITSNTWLGAKFWENASKTFASNARGTATKVGEYEGYFWTNFEKPILIKNNIPIVVIP